MKNIHLIKYIILVFLIFTAGCDYILLERDNPLDPMNPDSVRPRVSLVEVFVNDNSTFCGYAEDAVSSLATDDFLNKVVVLQYHIHNSTPDAYSSGTNSESDIRYQLLRKAGSADEREPGLPDIYVNGTYNSLRENNVQGASSASSVELRLNALLNSESANSNFTIEGSITKTNQPVMSISVAKLGKGNASGVTLKCAVLEDIQIDEKHHYVVRDLAEEPAFSINASDTKEFTLNAATISAVNTANIYGAAWIENSAGLVLQSAFIR